MKRHLLLVILLCLTVSSYSQVNLDYKGSLKGLFALLQSQYGYKFIYSNDEINDRQIISIVFTNSSIEHVLKEISKQTHISYRIINKQIIFKYDKKKPEKQAGLNKNIPEIPAQKPDSVFIIKNKPIQDIDKVVVQKDSVLLSGKMNPDIKIPMPALETKPDEVAKTSISQDTNLFSAPDNPKHEPESLITTVDSTSKAEAKIATNSNRSFEFCLQNNLLYDVVLTPNLGLECRIYEKWGIIINGLWTHINWDNGNKTYRIWAVNPEIRYYLLDNKRFYVGGMFHTGQLNLKLGETGHQGDFIGGGFTTGYLIPLSKHFQLDLGIGLGYTCFKYESYQFVDGLNTRQDSGIQNFWGPTKAGITLTFKL